MSLTGKIALVTGASRGIGQAIAMGLARQGAKTVGTATTTSGAEAISRFFEEANLPGQGLVLDVCQQTSIDQLLETMEQTIGSPDILVNNAGVTRDNLLLRMTDDEWDSIIQTNLTSIYRLTKASLKHMFRQRWGRIINISSIVAASGNSGQVNYAAAKAGLIGFSKSLAQEIASRNITVNVVAPGFIDTDMTRGLPDLHRDQLLSRIPMKRLGTGEDIAGSVVFLASPAANYITGQTLHVNGGMYML